MKHRFFFFADLQARCGEGLENDSSGPQVTEEEREIFQYLQTIEHIYIFLYLKAFLYLFILQKGTVKQNLPQLHSLL